MSDSLGEALPKEMARVRDKIIPVYQECGIAGRPALSGLSLRDIDEIEESSYPKLADAFASEFDD